MSANSVRFWHWLGFEPPAIYPPNEETTQALAFLGYDIILTASFNFETPNVSFLMDCLIRSYATAGLAFNVP
jgi:hypothetical protein